MNQRLKLFHLGWDFDQVENYLAADAERCRDEEIDRQLLEGVRTMDLKKHLRGFASMDPQRQRELAQMGGRAAHQKGTAHKFTPEEAREAGRKSWLARKAGVAA